MEYQGDYAMRTISDLMRTIARLVLGKSDINYDLPEDEDKYADLDRVYKRLRDLVDEGDISDAEDLLTDKLDTNSLDCLEMALTFYMYLGQSKDEEFYTANYSREEIADGIDSVRTECGTPGFQHSVDTTMV